jgi:hypothetical protein
MHVGLLRLNRSKTASVVVAALAIAGCGSSKDYANDPRPSTPINVSAVISQDKVSVDPKTFGGGPVTMIIANLTEKTHKVTVETDELGASNPGLKQTSSSINPQGTATLKVDMKSGSYTVRADDPKIKPAHVKVGKSRASSQDELLQP